jgi:hypothetical protein
MRRVLAAGVAELLELQTTGCTLLVLGRRIVPVLAICTLKCNDVPHFLFPLLTCIKRTDFSVLLSRLLIVPAKQVFLKTVSESFEFLVSSFKDNAQTLRIAAP